MTRTPVSPVKLLALFLCTILYTSPTLSDVRFVDKAPAETARGNVRDFAHVELFGEISDEDAKAVGALIERVKERSSWRSSQRQAVVLVFLDSPGGSVLAAIRIGELLRANDAMVWVEGECSSACVFVLAGGVDRNLILDSRIGLHRPFFEQKFFAGLSSQEAQRKYRELIAQCRSYLDAMGLSDRLFEEMLKVPSQGVQYVGRKYAEEVGLLGKDPGYEEWKRAKDLKELGPARLEARDRFLACVNSGASFDSCKLLHPF